MFQYFYVNYSDWAVYISLEIKRSLLKMSWNLNYEKNKMERRSIQRKKISHEWTLLARNACHY